MANSPNARSIQEAAHRDTEGKSSLQTTTKSTETIRERKRGRPKGSKNKPKALIPKEVASDLLGVVKQTLPPELYEEMKKSVREGKNISTINEARILMKMMGPPVWQRLIQEAQQTSAPAIDIDPDLLDEIGGVPSVQPPGFDKDLNERLKVLINLMQFVAKLEQQDEESNNSTQPILEITARRGIDLGRIGLLIGSEPGSMGGNLNRVGRAEGDTRAIPDSVSERPLDLQDSQQVSSVRIVNADSIGNDAQGSDDS